MRILIDTNRYTDFANKDPAAVARFLEAEELIVPFIVLAELRAGFRSGTLSRRNEDILARFLSNAKVRPLYPDERTTHVYADLYALLRSRGTPIPANDIWIASLAVQHSLPLYTRDRHFQNIPRLSCI